MSDLPLLKTMKGEEIERLKRRVAELEEAIELLYIEITNERKHSAELEEEMPALKLEIKRLKISVQIERGKHNINEIKAQGIEEAANKAEDEGSGYGGDCCQRTINDFFEYAQKLRGN